MGVQSYALSANIQNLGASEKETELMQDETEQSAGKKAGFGLMAFIFLVLNWRSDDPSFRHCFLWSHYFDFWSRWPFYTASRTRKWFLVFGDRQCFARLFLEG